MSAQTPTPPKALQTNSVEARIIKQKIWRACNINNKHFMAAIVGREGSGKSHTGLKLGEVADPTFNAKRIMFEPKSFLERLQTWKANDETKGKVVMADEAGVGLGARSWYDKDQILFNKVLQVIRDENMAIFFTLPRLNELDSQTRGRLHAMLEMTDKEDGEWAEFKWLNWDPSRDERDKTYRKYPRFRINGHVRKVKRLRVSPPSPELVEEYERRKTTFQEELYAEAIDQMDDSEEEKLKPKEIADKIIEDDTLEDYVLEHSANGRNYVAKELIRGEWELSHGDAKQVKNYLEKELSDA